MAHTTNSILARIEWCRWQRMQAHELRESEEWHAEEDGLQDALLNQDHSNRYRSGPSKLFVRYAIGLQDGVALLRIGAADRQFVFSGKGHQAIPRRDENHDGPK
jgi:hypothetical protein